MYGFKKYLRTLGTLSEQSINDDMSRINIMKNRNIDYTKGEEYTKAKLEKSNLSESTIKSCLRLCKRYKDYKGKLNKDVVSSIIDAYRKAILFSKSEPIITDRDIEVTNNGKVHMYRSSKFIEYASNRIKEVLEDDDIYVFSRKVERHKDFNLNEYLYDIHACRIKKLKSVNGNDVEYIEKSLVQIESEFSNNSKEVSKDFSKLVCGNSDLKIMIVRRASKEEGFRNSFLDIARNVSGELYLIQLEHPENWGNCSDSDYKVFIYNEQWKAVEL